MSKQLEERSCGRANVQLPFDDQMTQGARLAGRTRIAGTDQHELVEPELLADQDSCFAEFNGVKIHHKVVSDSCNADLEQYKTVIKRQPMVLLHGFGASLFSWNRVMKPLAELSGSKVLAFDRPAFGLTSRRTMMDPNNSELNPYSMTYSVLSTLFFINFLGAEKTVLVGHSIGSIVAVNTYFQDPERIAALILVDPAIVAPFTSSGIALKGRIYKFIEEAITQILKWIAVVMAAILRSAFGVMVVRVAIEKFGVPAVKFAWHDQSRVSEHTLDGYTKPMRCKGWDRALVEFLAAMLDFTDHESKPTLSKQLSQISCPVLIIAGDDDRVTPSWNSERLSKAIPGSSFEVIKQCGHIPHEERVEEFVSAVQRFLQRTSV